MQGPCSGRCSACGCSVVQAEASLLAHLDKDTEFWVGSEGLPYLALC